MYCTYSRRSLQIIFTTSPIPDHIQINLFQQPAFNFKFSYILYTTPSLFDRYTFQFVTKNIYYTLLFSGTFVVRLDVYILQTLPACQTCSFYLPSAEHNTHHGFRQVLQYCSGLSTRSCHIFPVSHSLILHKPPLRSSVHVYESIPK